MLEFYVEHLQVLDSVLNAVMVLIWHLTAIPVERSSPTATKFPRMMSKTPWHTPTGEPCNPVRPSISDRLPISLIVPGSA